MKRRRRTAWALLLVFSLLCSVFPAGIAAGAGVIRWPKNAEIISEKMFYGDAEIEQVIIPEGVREIRSKAFAESSLCEITIPDSIEFIAEDAFENSSLRTVHANKGMDGNNYGYNWMRNHGYLVEYRALVIGEKTFLRDDSDQRVVQRNVGDANEMQKMLQQKVYGPMGLRYTVNKQINLSRAGIEEQIQSTFADTMEQDVSLFFIATHGTLSRGGDLEMPFLLRQKFLDRSTPPEEGDPDYEEYLEFLQTVGDFNANGQYLSFDTLASWLNSYVQGKVIVILESCYSGYAIYDGIAENSVSATLHAGKSSTAFLDEDDTFAERAVEAFAKADPGTSEAPALFNKKSNGTGTGALRQPKFYVLAASRRGEKTWGYANGSVGVPVMNLFTIWLLEGIGRPGASPADQFPQDGILTLRELFEYINRYSNVTMPDGKQQHVQCYPQDSEFECFILK